MAERFQVIPAVDILGGCCVRLAQGDFDRSTAFGDDPVAMARPWADQGIARLHVVDLDGARRGVPVNLHLVRDIVGAIDVPVQLGGGLRTLNDVEQAFAVGVERVMLGTVALADRELLREALRRHGERIVVALDARQGRVATRGWMEQSEADVTSLARELVAEGVVRFLYTDILRDGLLEGPDAQGVAELARVAGVAVLAAGGIARPEHLEALRDAGAEGAVVGRALYEGTMTLAEALARC